MSKTRAKEIERSIERIWSFYHGGTELPEKQSHSEVYGQRIVSKEAKRRALPENRVRMMRALADRSQGYSQGELRRLCDLVRKEQVDQADDAPIFTVSHLTFLVTVPKNRREGLQQAAIKEAWSSKRLAQELAKRYGPRKLAGRRPKILKTTEDVLSQIESFASRWIRWFDLLGKEREPGETRVELKQLPPTIRKQAQRATTAVRHLHQATARELGKRRPGRAARSE